jgi:hypothetical protein
MAGVKYIANGDPAGGDLTGTYPDPMIAAGKVTSEKFAPTAKAPDADRLDELDSTEFLSATGKAADSDKLDGLDSTAFLQNSGSTAGGLSEVIISNSGADLRSLSVSPGKSYALLATAEFANQDSENGAPVICSLEASNVSGQTYAFILDPARGSTAYVQTVTLSGIDSGSVSTVTFSCYVNTIYGTTVRVRNARLTAIRLDSLTTN